MMAALVRIFVALASVISYGVTLSFDQPDLRYIKLYYDNKPDSPFKEFLDYSSNTSVQGVDNTIQRACYSGVWLLYNHYDYDYNVERDVYYLYGLDRCFNFSSPQSVLSLRYAGSPSAMNDVYFTLYEGDIFSGKEYKSNANSPSLGDLDMKVSSLVVNGQSPWTFFTGLQFTGEAVCVYPVVISGSNNIYLHHEEFQSMDHMGLPDNSIKSVAKGCLSSKIYRGDRQQVEHTKIARWSNHDHMEQNDQNILQTDRGGLDLNQEDHEDHDLLQVDHVDLDVHRANNGDVDPRHAAHGSLQRRGAEHV
ncbi:uncharacterized protein LOC108682985 [Hyalella azteca]|uniref:Uncharacterized protein LOC108682985 n=1 Tax=Hyalella azteca TaxID=294128 RepID=A0A8B7PNG9_HYAAZ|nr:uncharacterized protein LOC108682985 [Hyalella azteca]